MSARGAQNAREDTHQRCFARAIWSEQPEHSARNGQITSVAIASKSRRLAMPCKSDASLVHGIDEAPKKPALMNPPSGVRIVGLRVGIPISGLNKLPQNQYPTKRN